MNAEGLSLVTAGDGSDTDSPRISHTQTPHIVLATLLSLIWLVFLTGMPFFNKATFHSYAHNTTNTLGHALPPFGTLTPTLIQMMGAGTGLLLVSFLGALCLTRAQFSLLFVGGSLLV